MPRHRSRRVIALLKKPARIGPLLTYARFVLVSMRKSPFFAAANPPLDVYEAHLAAAEAAQVQTLTGAWAAFSARNALVDQVKSDMDALRGYVQSVADADLDHAAIIIESAGMHVKHARGPSRYDFDVKNGPTSGVVILLSRSAGRRAVYYWQYSTDGENWTSLPETADATTTLSGLTPGVFYSFRCRRMTRKEGLLPWSQVIRLMAL